MNDILKKIDMVLEEAQAKLAELSKKQNEADAEKKEYIKLRSALLDKEKQLDARAVVIEKYENIDSAIENNKKTAAELEALDKKLTVQSRSLESREKQLAADKKELADMVKACKEKDKRLDDAKAAREVAKSEMQNKVLEEIKKKLAK